MLGQELGMLIEVFIPALVTMFVILDPIGLMPIFAVLTRDGGHVYQCKMARRSVLVASVVLVLSFFFGDGVLKLFGITIPAFRIAGGILLFATALEMIFEFSAKHRKKTAEDASLENAAVLDDVAVVPLAFPLLAGPGAITTTILLSSSHQGNITAQIIVVVALLLLMTGTYVLFRVSGRMMQLLGETVTSVITRLLGVILAALAIQFVIDGVKGALV